MSNEKTIKRMTLFVLTWPIFIELFLHMLMGNADTLMLSQFSDDSVAAVGVANQILNLLIVMFGFIATGSSIIVAQHLGANQRSTAADVSVISMVSNLIIGLILSIGIWIFSEPLLRMMDLPEKLMPEASIYLKIVGGFSFLQGLIMTVGAVLRSYSFTRDTMYVTIWMNLLNIFGNYLVIFGPFGFPILGVEGVALSTTFSRMIGLVMIGFLLFKRINEKLPFRSFYRIPKVHLKNLLKIGIPSAGEHLSYNASQIIITYFITLMGTEALTTKVYAQNIMMFIFLFSVAVSQGTQIMIGYLVGERKLEEAYNRCLKSLKIAVAISALMAVLFSFCSEALLSIFTSNEDIISTGTTLIFLTILLEPGRAFNLVIINSLRAAGDVTFPVYMGILSMWGVSVTISYFLGIILDFGLAGIWISFIVDEWLRGLLMLRRWRSRIWEKKAFLPRTA
ncbi:MATE family efflux transporter [Priestia abyssalis]|uniref:MATE family efflux transporter n=1 Tax=Priestia abyssalis TaxID=1221450 RepID=UPI0009950663|nr:MATE family efflux transporter [Priestia abyssalis]